MQMSYTYWKVREDVYIGFIDQYPDFHTQGDSIEELERMLFLLYAGIKQVDDVQLIGKFIDTIAVPVNKEHSLAV